MQVQALEYEEVPEGTGKGEWKRRQEGGVDVWVTGGGAAVLQLQHRDDVGAGWGAGRAVQMRTDRAVLPEPGWRGRYRVAAVVGLAYEVAGGPGRGGPGQEGAGRGGARRRKGCKWGACTLH